MYETLMSKCSGASTNNIRRAPRMIEAGILSKIPLELLHHILKFLSSEDLVACSLVCKFLNGVASDESLWRRLVMQMTWWSSSGIAQRNSRSVTSKCRLLKEAKLHFFLRL